MNAVNRWRRGGAEGVMSKEYGRVLMDNYIVPQPRPDQPKLFAEAEKGNTIAIIFVIIVDLFGLVSMLYMGFHQ